MKIKSIKNFRWHYKTQVRRRNDRNTNTNFVGVYHDVGDKRTNGYFELTHGDKKIHKFLPSILKIAEDGQAIYEFIQNAVDCNSSQFFIFYNDKYFLAVNNGQPFNHKDVLSILNIADTTKDESCENIGRFGIGFKLVHRLVGKDEGIKELVEDYKGPVIYSWNNIKELKMLLASSKYDDFRVFPDFVKNPTDMDNSKTPWLFKIIATNFPAEPGEKVLDINYNEKVLFPYSELKEIIEYLKENFKTHQGRFDFENLEQGSLFFLKLGEGKRKLLDDDYKGLENGVQYSMNFLKNLEEVYINDNSLKKRDLKIQEFIIQKGSEAFNEINPEYANCDIKISFGYTDYKSARGIRKSPNFYKYFPMGDETNGFSFILHCDSFDIEANRRKLHDSNKNRKLFPEISKSITQYADELKERDFDEFLNLYSNLLVSRIPYRDNNKWLYSIFFENLLNYIQTNIPIKKGTSELKDNVKIKDISFDIHLPMLGLDKIEWFYWENKKENEYLIEEAENSEKLNIEKWDITNVFVEADLEKLDNWIKQLSNSYYNQFIKELESHYYSEKTIGRLTETKLFKFSDGNFYSINQINGSNNLIVLSKKTSNIKAELLELGFIISELDFSKYKFYEKISQFLKSDKSIFEEIASRTAANNLTANQKINLFRNFVKPETKFVEVGDESLKSLSLFCDSNNRIKPLSKLIDYNYSTPIWLNAYKIKSDEYFSELKPFLISETEYLFKDIYLPNKDVILPELTEATEIKSLIKLYQDYQKAFFKEFIIKKCNNNYIIEEKLIDTYQVQSADKEARNFIDKNCVDNLFVLPFDFSNYKDEDGIIKADDLYSLILDFIDTDEHKVILVDIVKYKAKYKFIQELSEFRFNVKTIYTKEDYEYKILDLVCNELKEDDFERFRSKVVIETKNKELKLSEIPPFADKIKIENQELSLTKILPDTYQNSDHLSNLINQFVSIGSSMERIENLFGIKQEVEPSEIFNLFSEQTDILENAEQMAFLVVYGKVFEESIENFKVKTLDEKEWELKYDYYTNPFSFIGDDYLLKNQYSDISKILDLPIAIGKSEHLIMQQPYISETKFVCPNIKSTLTDEEKIDFFNFIFSEWKKDRSKFTKEIDWNKIGEAKIEEVLSFKPTYTVYPNKYASENEVLPDYLIKWLGEEESKITFLSDIGVWVKNSIIIELRKLLSGKTQEFQYNRIVQETRFNNDETTLINTFEWLKDKEIELSTEEQFDTFKKVVEIINNNRTGGDLITEEKNDFELLNEHSTEWKDAENYTILLYNGELPIIVGLDEIKDYVFYRYSNGDYVVKDDKIYINSNTDKKNTLQKVASDENNDFSFEELWTLFGESSNKEQELEKEIAKLKQQVAKTDSATLGTEFSNDISKNDQKEANREAKEIVKEKLEAEGFEFTNGLGEYSTINGVFKDGIKFSLVVKSYKYQDEPLKIGANEWIQLMKPDSMFWLYFGNGKLGSLKLYDLLRNQDKLKISFSTENLDKEDRIEKFAELLHYFGDVHFDFNSVKPSDYSVADDLKNYRFDERKTEEDLSGDAQNLL